MGILSGNFGTVCGIHSGSCGASQVNLGGLSLQNRQYRSPVSLISQRKKETEEKRDPLLK